MRITGRLWQVVAAAVAVVGVGLPVVVSARGGLKYSTFLGGSSSDGAYGIALDAARNAYVTGETFSGDFPITTGAIKDRTGFTFLTKLNPKGRALLYSAQLPGTARASALTLGPALPATPTQPTVYLAGGNEGGTAPTPTADAFQSTCHLGQFGTCFDVWLGRVNPVGGGGTSDLVWATYLGGSGNDFLPGGDLAGGGLAVDEAGRAYVVVGRTQSTDTPITAGTWDSSTNYGPFCGIPSTFVGILDPSLPGDGTGVPSATNQQLVWSTFVDGAGIAGIAVGPGSTVYVTGNTGVGGCAGEFPASPGAFDTSPACPGLYCKGLFAKFDPSLPGDGTGVHSATNQQMVYGTYFGELTKGYDVAVDAAGRGWISGETYDATLPQKDALQSTCGCFYRSVNSDGFVAGFEPAGNGEADLVFSTYLGGTRGDWFTGIALAPGSVYVAGNSNSYKNSDGHLKADRYPVTPNAYQVNSPGAASECECYDAVASKISGL